MIVCVSKADESNAAESKDNTEDDENTIKIYKRLIPADVLRGKSWDPNSFLCLFSQSFENDHLKCSRWHEFSIDYLKCSKVCNSRIEFSSNRAWINTFFLKKKKPRVRQTI